MDRQFVYIGIVLVVLMAFTAYNYSQKTPAYETEGEVIGTVVMPAGFSSSTECIVEYEGGNRATTTTVGACKYIVGDRVILRVDGTYVRIIGFDD